MNREKMIVLVVDDSDPIRERVVHMVREASAVGTVLEARDAKGAIDQILSESPDIVVLDLKMPGGGGVAVLEQFPPDANARPLFVVLTNFPYPQLRAKCVELGVDHFLDKFADYERIVEIVEARGTKEHSNETRSGN